MKRNFLRHHFAQHAVDAVSHAHDFPVRLDVNVGRLVADRGGEDVIDQAGDRRIFGDFTDLFRAFALVDDFDFSAFERREQAVDVDVGAVILSMASVMACAAAQDELDRAIGDAFQIIEIEDRERVGDADGQPVVDVKHGDHAVVSRFVLRDVADHFGIDESGPHVHRGQADLLTDDFENVERVDEAEGDECFPEHFAGFFGLGESGI